MGRADLHVITGTQSYDRPIAVPAPPRTRHARAPARRPGAGMPVLESTELDGRNGVSPWPSDHRAVISRFALTPPTLADKASDPSPAPGATNVSTGVSLSWLPGSNTLSHKIYFGTSSPGVFRTNQTNAAFAPGPFRR